MPNSGEVLLPSAEACRPSGDCDGMVQRIRLKSPGAVEELRRFLLGGPRFLAAREFGAVEAKKWCLGLQSEVVAAIDRGGICDGPSLLASIHAFLTALRVDAKTTGSGNRRAGEKLSQAELRMTQPISDVLRSLPPRHQEALVRHYVFGEGEETICGELNLSVTQFRFLKRRVKSTIAVTSP